MSSGIVRLIDRQARVVVTDDAPPTTVLPGGGNDPQVVVDREVVRVVTQGVQGPPGPAIPLPGVEGDVLFRGSFELEVETGVFSYSRAQQALSVRRLTGAVVDGGNF